MKPTHAIIFRPVGKYRRLDTKRRAIYYHSDQVKELYRNSMSWVLVDYKGVIHYIPYKTYELSIGILNDAYLFGNSL